MKKAFISILGTNDYLECRHRFGDIVTDTPVKYCQQDIIKLFCEDFNEDSEIKIFLTEEAEKKNWLDNGHIDRNTKHPIPNKGLKSRLEELNPTGKIKSIPIKEGYNENEIWEIFQTIYDSFREEEEVIVDITHSFRSLPMLMITLLNFAKQIKKIKVNGIYYAAFESLGTINDVRNIPAQERVAPILDLTSFSELQDWTNATFDFVNNANTSKLKQLVKISVNRSSITKPVEKFFPTRVIEKLDSLISSIALCRGRELVNFNFQELKKDVATLKNKDLPKAFIYLVDEIEKKISTFNNNPKLLTITLIHWCLTHNLYQQAITLLQEFTISRILLENQLEFENEIHRILVAQAFRIHSQNIPQNEWKKPASDNIEFIQKLLKCETLTILSSEYDSLTNLRNDVNHAGFLSSARSFNSIKSRLIEIFDNYKKYLL
ncbi:TIGR02221 family CRISPR-associated protein [Stygiobacter electus]|uniref:TIGR02221 family CRISPR-associated protein n=1 Tax=Stygiobacter electus TaxID=3032292 RepID=A0AAE3NXR9_9BACT|nr:TIGR02221 family CRISPR-associated protein [Stygiobacter electus]MDF1610550.1 TIGR02221 family CRISPR-associated protein [Stygiobacter electus]